MKEVDYAQLESFRVLNILSDEIAVEQIEDKVYVVFCGIILDYSIWFNLVFWTLTNSKLYESILLSENKDLYQTKKLNKNIDEIQNLSHRELIGWLYNKFTTKIKELSPESLDELIADLE